VSQTALYGLVGALLVGVGLYGLIVGASALRKLIAFNVLGSGVFLIFGVIARRGAGAGFGGDPVPQALVITGLVVAFAATALTVGLLVRLAEVSGRGDVDDDLRPTDPGKTRGLLPDPAATDAPAAAAKAPARPQP
jgi:multicomponent Na+:H+ antiporter subunit C